MSYVILDLEWNGSYSKVLHKFVNEIIEIGAVKLDDELNVCDTFTMLVAPKIGKKLCSKVKQLTKITNEELKDEGVSFIRAISLFSDFLGRQCAYDMERLRPSCSYRKLQLLHGQNQTSVSLTLLQSAKLL